MIREGMVLVTPNASLRAISDGLALNPPIAHPMVSASVLFTWWTVSGGRSSYLSVHAYSLRMLVVRSMFPPKM